VIAETRATMAWVIDQCLILLHPTMPFITEELWGEIADAAEDADPRRLARLRRGADRRRRPTAR
jgi:valyl-tRNA synthetase